MKIYRISPETKKRNLKYSSISLDDSLDIVKAIEDIKNGILSDFYILWNKEKTLGDFCFFSLGDLCLSKKSFECLKSFFNTNELLFNLEDFDFIFIRPEIFNDLPSKLPHVFWYRPLTWGTLVTETFKQTWEEGGLTGAVFTEVGELDDSLF